MRWTDGIVDRNHCNRLEAAGLIKFKNFSYYERLYVLTEAGRARIRVEAQDSETHPQTPQRTEGDMTDDSKATPRPWKAAEESALDYRPSSVVTADGKSRIALMYGGGPIRAISKAEERANAALIVSTVNEHDVLVAERDRLRQALEEARLQLEYLHSRWPTGSTEGSLARIREALGDG